MTRGEIHISGLVCWVLANTTHSSWAGPVWWVMGFVLVLGASRLAEKP